MVYLYQILHTYLLEHCLATCMQNGDEAMQTIILVGQGLLVKILIAREHHNTF